jgi:hypothetical protein
MASAIPSLIAVAYLLTDTHHLRDKHRYIQNSDNYFWLTVGLAACSFFLICDL